MLDQKSKLHNGETAMTIQTPSPGTAPGLSVTVESLPSALRVDRLESVSDDAQNIAILANTTLEYLGTNVPSQVGPLLYMISDLAEILSWNLSRMDDAQRAVK